ncbi:hypothetical protein [Methanocella arvoryzae]|nr:hypothetical protein [Methanocella arvoryzae]
MAKGAPPAGSFIIVTVIIIALIAFIALIYFTPGETYVVHVTVFNNATPESPHSSVYLGHDLKPTTKLNESLRLSPGESLTFDADEWFPTGKNTTFKFQAAVSGEVLSTVSYHADKNESSVNLTWDGSDLHLSP